MTGTGTQADPYQITNQADLDEFVMTDGAYGKIMNDINYNCNGLNISPSGYGTDNIATHLDGNNKNITIANISKNMWYTNGTTSSSVWTNFFANNCLTIENLNFEILWNFKTSSNVVYTYFLKDSELTLQIVFLR